MELDDPRFVPREAVAGIRPCPPEGFRFAGLWVAGDLGALAGRTVAVVGCRAPSDGGRRRAHVLGRALGSAGVCVLSGLALGIDGAAHAGALEAGAPTIGVLGGGHRRFFPRRNRALAEAMLSAGGAVVSPYAPDEPARPFQFLHRNALVAGLADAVVVVEAAARSGALNTATWAAERSVPVFAIPGDPDHPKAAGCNALLRDGAILARDAADVLQDLKWSDDGPAQLALDALPPAKPGRDPLESALLGRLRLGAQSTDTLIEDAERASEPPAPGAVLAALVRLEIRGEVERRDGGYALR